MKIGFGQADITPKGKVYLIGQFHTRITEEICDPLRAVAMIVETDSARTVWVSMDSLWVCEGASDLALKAVREVLPDLKEEEFVLSATHIHTGPSYWADTYCALTGDRTEPEGAQSAAECAKHFAAGIRAAVADALAHLTEARADLAISRMQTGVNRRVVYQDGHAQMYGDPTKPDFLKMEGRDGGPIQLLYVYDQGGRLMGIVVNAPCTAQCDEGACYVTADFWGVVREKLAGALGEDVRILPLCRSAGDLSPHQIVDAHHAWRVERRYHGRQAAIDLGNRVAETVLAHRDRVIASYQGDVPHAQGMRVVDFPVWQPTQKEYDDAIQYLGDPANFGEDGRPLSAFAKSAAVACKERHERGDRFYPCAIYGMRLGDLVFLSNPFELYIEYADRIRMALKDSVVFDVELTHGCMGYLPTATAVRGGGYSALIFNSVCGPEGGETLVKESIELAKELIQK